MRTLQCPRCGSRWKVIPEPMGPQEVVWVTCAPCEVLLPQQVHEADRIEDDELNAGD
jgi:hypothetical protein